MSLDDIVLPDQLKTADRVRELRGLPPINPHVIEGFGEPEPEEAPPEFPNPYPELATTHTASSAPTTTTQVDVSGSSVEVFYQGSRFLGDQQFFDKVESLILKLVVRETTNRLKMLEKPRVPTRVSGVRGTQKEQGGASPAAKPVVSKRGRPKGAKNKKTLEREAANVPLGSTYTDISP